MASQVSPAQIHDIGYRLLDSTFESPHPHRILTDQFITDVRTLIKGKGDEICLIAHHYANGSINAGNPRTTVQGIVRGAVTLVFFKSLGRIYADQLKG